MKHMMLIVGDELRINSSHLNSIFEAYESHFDELGDIKFQSKNSELLFIIEELAKNNDSVSIFCATDAFATIAKILSTLSGNSLELLGDTLAPKSAIDVKNGSILIKLGENFVNLIRADVGEKIAEILVPFESKSAFFSLLDTEVGSAKILLAPLATPYKIDLAISQMLPNCTFVRAQKLDPHASLDPFLQSVKNLFSSKMINAKDTIKFIAEILIKNGKKITFAESCTAGICAAKFAKYSGVSAALDGSVVTYANRIKNEWLGVSDEILQTHGAVSEQCVRAMLKGALDASLADFALAISGIAGPDGGSEQKPVGTIFVAAGDRDGAMIVERVFLKGDRNQIREQSAMSAYACLLRLAPKLFFRA